jgi:hypothetical protein
MPDHGTGYWNVYDITDILPLWEKQSQGLRMLGRFLRKGLFVVNDVKKIDDRCENNMPKGRRLSEQKQILDA